MIPHPGTLPSYSAEKLVQSTPPELLRLLIRNEDRVPRSLIDECARRGEAMLDLLEDALRKDYYWEDPGMGEWWLRLHAVMILGLMPDARAGELLVGYMRRIDEVQDEHLHDWLGGRFSAFFRNKPAGVMASVRALAEDRERSASIRSDATDAAVAYAESRGETELNEALGWLARMAFDPEQDLELRAFAGNTLLDFARPEHRAALEALADAQDSAFPIFDRESVETVYAEGGAAHSWARFGDPWAFYTRTEIAKRQIRWAEELIREEEEAIERDYEALRGETYVREGPKVGRNDPCPCGSGKKYKKCCMAGAADA